MPRQTEEGNPSRPYSSALLYPVAYHFASLARTCPDSSRDGLWILFRTADTRGLVLGASMPFSHGKRWFLQSGQSSILYSGLVARLGYGSYNLLQTSILTAAILGRAFSVLLHCPDLSDYPGHDSQVVTRTTTRAQRMPSDVCPTYHLGHGSSYELGLPRV